MKDKCANSLPVRSWTPSAMRSSSVAPSPLHNAHLSISLEFQFFLQRIAGRRPSKAPRGGCSFDVRTLKIGRFDNPRCPFAKLARRKLTVLDQTSHGRRADGEGRGRLVQSDFAAL